MTITRQLNIRLLLTMLLAFATLAVAAPARSMSVADITTNVYAESSTGGQTGQTIITGDQSTTVDVQTVINGVAQEPIHVESKNNAPVSIERQHTSDTEQGASSTKIEIDASAGKEAVTISPLPTSVETKTSPVTVETAPIATTADEPIKHSVFRRVGQWFSQAWENVIDLFLS